MIPTHFDAAYHVFPKVILGGQSQRQEPVRVGGSEIVYKEFMIATVAQVFGAAMQAELLGCLVAGVTGDGPGFTADGMDIEIIERRPKPQTLYRGADCRAEVIAGLVF